MKKLAITTISLGMLALIAVPVMAGPKAGPGYGNGQGYGRGQGYAQNLSKEDFAKIQAARAAFLTDSQELRKQAAVKRIELQTLYAQPNPDQAKIKALRDEMIDLRAQIAKKRNHAFSSLPAGLGRGFGRGMSSGYGPGQGRHRGSGFRGGPGNGPRMGSGFRGGPGYGAGYGPGYCWR